MRRRNLQRLYRILLRHEQKVRHQRLPCRNRQKRRIERRHSQSTKRHRHAYTRTAFRAGQTSRRETMGHEEKDRRQEKQKQMNAPNIDWTAILTIALAQLPTMVIVALGVLYNNARITDLRATLTELIRAQGDIINARHEAQMQALLRVEGDLDTRLTQF